MATAGPVKMEDAGAVKEDPDDAPMPLAEDDDAFEDTGELEMPKQLPAAWLTRVPKQLYDCWATFDDDEPIQIGVVRHFENTGKHRLILDGNARRQDKVPKLYDLAMTDKRAPNTFIFTEKDLPGYTSRGRGGARPAHNTDRRDFLSSNSQAGISKSKRYQTRYRTPVAKQTKLAASISNEVTCTAVENEEYNRMLKEQMEQTKKSQDEKLTVLEGDVRQYSGLVLSKTKKKGLNEGGFDTFIRTGPVLNKSKNPNLKSVRMPENELLDKLFDLFKQYKYFSWRGIKQRIPQPDEYLRATLTRVADQVKSGSFAGTYKLRDEWEDQKIDMAMKGDIKEETAPENVRAASASEEPDDDEEEMEDVFG